MGCCKAPKTGMSNNIIYTCRCIMECNHHVLKNIRLILLLLIFINTYCACNVYI